MRLRMVSAIAGLDFNVAPGDVTERFSGEEAARLIRAGYAVAIGPEMERTAKIVPALETRQGKARRNVVSG